MSHIDNMIRSRGIVVVHAHENAGLMGDILILIHKQETYVLTTLLSLGYRTSTASMGLRGTIIVYGEHYT